jgi:toxin ParE1/3/4
MKSVVFHDQATSELEEAASWYELHRPGLGGQFHAAVEDAVTRIQFNPQSGTRHGDTQFRFVLVRRFPYVVYYRETAHSIRIMAIAHGRRRPDYWRNRGK